MASIYEIEVSYADPDAGLELMCIWREIRFDSTFDDEGENEAEVPRFFIDGEEKEETEIPESLLDIADDMQNNPHDKRFSCDERLISLKHEREEMNHDHD